MPHLLDRPPPDLERSHVELERVRRLDSELARAVDALRAIVRSLPRDERVEILAALSPADRDRLDL